MKRLITLGFGLFLTAVATGCCCWPCCNSGCGMGSCGGGCSSGGCAVPGGVTSNYSPTCPTCAY